MRASRHYVEMSACPVLDNQRDDKAPDDKIRHVFMVIYCPWSSSIAHPQIFLGAKSGRPFHCAWPIEVFKYKVSL